MANKPIVLLLSRDLQRNESKVIHSLYNNVITLNEHYAFKKVDDWDQNTCVLVDLQTSSGRAWVQLNYLTFTNTDKIVWIHSPGQKLADSSVADVLYRSKNMNCDATTRAQFEFSVMNKHIDLHVKSRLKRFLGWLSDCLSKQS